MIVPADLAAFVRRGVAIVAPLDARVPRGTQLTDLVPSSMCRALAT